MIYQKYLTKFIVIKPLEFKRPEEGVHNLIDIFTLLGRPLLWKSHNGRKFSNQIKILGAELKIVHGKPRHSQSQGTVELANPDMKNMFTT
jgi:hypothetical protein